MLLLGFFDNEGMVTAIMMNFDLSEEEARSIVGMAPKPSTDISVIEPSLEKSFFNISRRWSSRNCRYWSRYWTRTK